MALEAVVFQQDPFTFGSKDFYYGSFNGFSDEIVDGYWESSASNSVVQSSSSTTTLDGMMPEMGGPVVVPPRRKRRRTRVSKNKVDVENQRMTHIAVERNRRKQMNEYLAVLRNLMPGSYVQRGDQASIVGGAINFVKELEHHLQTLEANKGIKQQSDTCNTSHFSDFFAFPQYSTYSSSSNNSTVTTTSLPSENQSAVADIEVTMVETHANIKVLMKRRPKQLFKMVAGFHSFYLTVLHLNVATLDQMVLYSFSVKVEDDCQLTTVNEIATAVYEMVGMIQRDSSFI